MDYVVMLSDEDRSQVISLLAIDRIYELNWIFEKLELDNNVYVADVPDWQFYQAIIHLKRRHPKSPVLTRFMNLGELQDPNFLQGLDNRRREMGRYYVG